MTCECTVVAGGGLGGAPFGAVPFGSQFPDVVNLTGEAKAITANTVLVPFTGTIDLPNPLNPDSPLNPSNWQLTVVDPLDAKVRLAQRIVLLDETTLPTVVTEFPQVVSATLPSFIVQFDGVLTEGATYTIELLSEDAQVSQCDCAEFVALFIRVDAKNPDNRQDDGFIIDISNPFLTRDAIRFPPALGTYQITDTGDIALEKSGISSLRKRIFRRVITAAGGFFHLPGYGVGPQIKSLIKVDEVQRLSSRIRAQVLKEPEVVQASVRVTRVLNNPEMLSVNVRVLTISGDPDSIVVPISIP